MIDKARINLRQLVRVEAQIVAHPQEVYHILSTLQLLCVKTDQSFELMLCQEDFQVVESLLECGFGDIALALGERLVLL